MSSFIPTTQFVITTLFVAKKKISLKRVFHYFLTTNSSATDTARLNVTQSSWEHKGFVYFHSQAACDKI